MMTRSRMSQGRRALAGLWALLAMVAAPVATAAPVVIQGDDGSRGRGYAFRNGNSCVVLTAGHVIQPASSSGPSAITVSAAGAQLTTHAADWTVDAGLDAARLVLDVASVPGCTKSLEEPAWMRTARFGPSQQFTIPMRNPDGKAETIRLRYSASQQGGFLFAPETGQRALIQGDSGAILFLGEQPIGILARRSTTRPEAEVVRLDLVYAAWREALQVRAARIPIALAGVTERGREATRFIGLFLETLQRHPSIELARGNDPRACRISVDVAQYSQKRVTNPAHTKWSAQKCGSTSKLLDIICQASRGAEPPRYLDSLDVSFGLMSRAADGSIRVHNPGYTIQIPADSVDRGSAERQFTSSAFGRALDDGFRAGLCS
jgi:hypothetical protein